MQLHPPPCTSFNWKSGVHLGLDSNLSWTGTSLPQMAEKSPIKESCFPGPTGRLNFTLRRAKPKNRSSRKVLKQRKKHTKHKKLGGEDTKLLFREYLPQSSLTASKTTLTNRPFNQIQRLTKTKIRKAHPGIREMNRISRNLPLSRWHARKSERYRAREEE